MGFNEEYWFWRTAHDFIVHKKYRIVRLSQDQPELWLENTENQDAQLVRLLCHSLDWSRWLERDIELVAANSERVRRTLVRGNIRVVNIYFTPYRPVDDDQSLLKEPYKEPQKQKVEVTSLIVDFVDKEKSFRTLETVLGESIKIDDSIEPNEWERDRYRKEALDTASKREKADKEIFHTAKPFFTYVFLAIQLIVFALIEWKGSSQDTFTLIEFGAKFNPLILEGEWWRFFTPIFVHIGALHLFMNSIALYFLGPLVERIFGNVRFIMIYLFAGFAGTLASFIFTTNLSAGASGAIFGLFGALLYFGLVFPRLFFRTMGMNVIVVLGINLVFGFTMPGIDNAGHIGGLIGGFAAAGIVHFPKRKKIVKQGLFLLLVSAIIMGMLQYGYQSAAAVDEQSILILAQDHIINEEYNEAYELLTKYQSEWENSSELLFLLSFTEIKRNQLDSAKDHLLQAIEYNPDFHEAHYNLALVYLEQEFVEEAKEHAESAIELQPNNESYRGLYDEVMAFFR